jgi:membrane protein
LRFGPLAQRAVRAAAQSRSIRILRHTLAEFAEDDIPTVAAGITFFFLLALFPALACVMSLYGMFADRAIVAHSLAPLSGFLPEGAITVLHDAVVRLAAGREKIGWGFVTALALAIWGASGGVKALIGGLNVAYERKESRSFVDFTLHALLLTAIGVVLATAGVALAVTLPAAIASLSYGGTLAAGLKLAAWPLSFFACVLFSSAIFRFGPDLRRTRWRWINWGSVFSAALWMAGTGVFAWYVHKFGGYDAIYGPLAALVGFLTWIWLSLLVLLFGAELNCEIERGEHSRVSPPASA